MIKSQSFLIAGSPRGDFHPRVIELLGGIPEHTVSHALRHAVPRMRNRGSIDSARFQRHHPLSIAAAGGNKSDIAVGLSPFFFAIERTKKSVNDPRLDTPIFFPFKSSGRLISGRTINACTTAGIVCANIVISAPARSAAMTVGRGDGNHVQVATDQSFRAYARAHDRDDLGVEPVLFKELRFFGDKDNDVAHADGRHADVESY
jgi:hypothetical protein